MTYSRSRGDGKSIQGRLCNLGRLTAARPPGRNLRGRRVISMGVNTLGGSMRPDAPAAEKDRDGLIGNLIVRGYATGPRWRGVCLAFIAPHRSSGIAFDGAPCCEGLLAPCRTGIPADRSCSQCAPVQYGPPRLAYWGSAWNTPSKDARAHGAYGTPTRPLRGLDGSMGTSAVKTCRNCERYRRSE